MIGRCGGRAGVHGTPPSDCDHPGEEVHCGRDGETRCGRCWRVWRVYPAPGGAQVIWHYAQRTIIDQDLHRFGGRGGTI